MAMLIAAKSPYCERIMPQKHEKFKMMKITILGNYMRKYGILK